MISEFFKKYKYQIIIVLCGLVAQLAIFLLRVLGCNEPASCLIFAAGDSPEYLALGTNLATKGIFFQFDAPSFILEQYRMPLYPLFIALGYKLFHGTLWAIVLLQQLFSLAMLVAIYQVFLLFFKHQKIAFWGTIAVILDLHRILETTGFASEAIFLFFLFLVMYFLMKISEEQKYSYAAAAGLFLGLATMTRVFSYYLFFGSILFIFLIRFFRKVSFKRLFFCALIFLIVFQTVLLPWRIRNYKLFSVTKLSSASEFALFTRHIPRLYEYKEKLSPPGTFSADEASDKLYEDFYRDNQITDRTSKIKYYLFQFKYGQYLKNKSLEVIKDNLGLYLYIHAWRVPIWFVDNNMAFQAIFLQNTFYPILDKTDLEPVQILWFSRFIFLAFYLVILFGILRSPKSFTRLFPNALLVIIFAGSIAAMAVMILTPRHKMPINFFVYALVIYFLKEIIGYYRNKKNKHVPNIDTKI